MANIEAKIPINVDFCNKKYTVVNAKQYDKNARYLWVTCYNGGNLFKLSKGSHHAYIRYKKPDGYSVFNECTIDNEGKVLVALTEQMLAAQGTCVADLVIVGGGKATMNPDTGAIITIENGSVISTMIFHINVTETPVANSELESGFEHSVFNKALEEIAADFQNVILTAKSWAVGGTNLATRPDENINNAKYWAEVAKDYTMENLGGTIVTGVKGDTEYTYKTGQVSIGADDVGAIPTSDIATVDEVKTYLGINTVNS